MQDKLDTANAAAAATAAKGKGKERDTGKESGKVSAPDPILIVLDCISTLAAQLGRWPAPRYQQDETLKESKGIKDRSTFAHSLS